MPTTGSTKKNRLWPAIIAGLCCLLPLLCQADSKTGELALNLDYQQQLQAGDAQRQLANQGQSGLLSDGLKLIIPATYNQNYNQNLAGDKAINPQLLAAIGLTGQWLSADISQHFQPLAFGLSHRKLEAGYQGDQLLSFTQWSPHITGYIGDSLALRTGYTQGHKTLTGRPGREANIDSLAANLSWFLNSARAYFSLGAKYDDENAVDPEHDFNANTINLKVAKQFPFLARDGVLKIGASYEQRLYKNGVSALGEQRQEGRTRYQAELELPLTQQLQLILNAEFAQHESNFDTRDPASYVTGAELNFSF